MHCSLFDPGQAAHNIFLSGALDFVRGAAIIDSMPIYEYHCNGCGKEFETLVRSSTRVECPVCQSTALEKKLSVFATSASGGGEPAMAAGPCGSCGHPDGPGSCGFNPH